MGILSLCSDYKSNKLNSSGTPVVQDEGKMSTLVTLPLRPCLWTHTLRVRDATDAQTPPFSLDGPRDSPVSDGEGFRYRFGTLDSREQDGPVGEDPYPCLSLTSNIPY